MSVLATKYLAASIVLVSAHSWSTYSGVSEGIDEFKDGNIMLSMLLIGSSLGGGKKPSKGSKNKEKDNISYSKNKTHSTTTNNKLPGKGQKPNSSMDRVDEKGNLIQRRYYDKNGNAKKDIDFTDHGNSKEHPKVPHEHDWDWGKKPPRGPWR